MLCSSIYNPLLFWLIQNYVRKHIGDDSLHRKGSINVKPILLFMST